MNFTTNTGVPDFVVAGAGVSGCTVARKLADAGYQVLLLERLGHIGGLCADTVEEGHIVPLHGHHQVYTNDEVVWGFLSKFGRLAQSDLKANVMIDGELSPLPLCLPTLNLIYQGNNDPISLKHAHEKDLLANLVKNPKNLRDKIVNRYGLRIYYKIIEGYYFKQFGIPCTSVSPDSPCPKLLIRFETTTTPHPGFKYQGWPEKGFSDLFSSMLNHPNIRLELNTSYGKKNRVRSRIATIFTGDLRMLQSGHRICYRRCQSTVRANPPPEHGIYSTAFPDLSIPYCRIHYPAQIIPDLQCRTLHKEIAEFYFSPDDQQAFSSHPSAEFDFPCPQAENLRAFQLAGAACESSELRLAGRLASSPSANISSSVRSALRIAEAYTRK